MKITLPNYTQTPNELFDEWLPKLTGCQLKVLLVIIRKTFGFHKKRDRISLSQLEKFTGQCRRDIVNAILALEKLGIVEKDKSGPKGSEESYYQLVMEDSNNSNQLHNATGGGGIMPPTKEKIQKKEIDRSTFPEKTSSDEDVQKLADKLDADGFVVCKSAERNPTNENTHIRRPVLVKWIQTYGLKAVGRTCGSVIRAFRKNPKLKREVPNIERYVTGCLKKLVE